MSAGYAAERGDSVHWHDQAVCHGAAGPHRRAGGAAAVSGPTASEALRLRLPGRGRRDSGRVCNPTRTLMPELRGQLVSSLIRNKPKFLIYYMIHKEIYINLKGDPVNRRRARPAGDGPPYGTASAATH